MAGVVKYHDIKGLIESEILEGHFPPGSQLPSEPKLAEMYHASRGTIREALRNLEQDAVIARRSGIGTIVLREPKAALIMSFTDQVHEAGMTPSTVVLHVKQMMANETAGRVCEAFLLNAERAAVTSIYSIDRLRCGDGRPLARQTVYLLAADFGPGTLDTADFSGSMFALYVRYHRRVAWADEIVSARVPVDHDIKHLKLGEYPLELPFVYVRERISYDQENQPLEVLTSVDRSDFFQGYRYRIMEDVRLPVSRP